MDFKKKIQEAYNYEDYRSMIDELVAQGKTTGPIQGEMMMQHTTMNVQRMNKWGKIAKFDASAIERVNNLKCVHTWLVLTEAWCGDAAQNIPFMAKLAEQSPLINLKLLLRDENLDLMDQYLTNGGRGIPKLIVLNDKNEVVGDWGPRPEAAQEILHKHKTSEDWDHDAFHKELHLWYAKDRGQTTTHELLDLVDHCMEKK
jgi:hypothetical protein